MSTTGNRDLLSSILNKWERFQVLWKFGTLVLFYKALALILIFFLSQTTASQFHRVPTNFHIPWSDQLPCKIDDEQMKLPNQGVLNLIWKIAISTTTSPWAKTVAQNKKYLKVLKGSTWKFTWNGFEISCIWIYSGHFGVTWFSGVGCTWSIPSQYKWRLAKDWKITIERAITVIIMLVTK
jgi:hypothetical protein